MNGNDKITTGKTQVVLIGAGIMSATLGVLLKKLNPDIQIRLFERLSVGGAESSSAWNNAGTGHSAFCELNYTPENEDGSIDISKAIQIAESFEVSKQFWAFLVKDETITNPGDFIHRMPHMTFVRGEKNIDYLKRRYEALKGHPLFKGMTFIDDMNQLGELLPLMMHGRTTSEPVAATKMDIGTDVDFGNLTHQLLQALQKMPGVDIHFNHEVRDLQKQKEGQWQVHVETYSGNKKAVLCDFVFIGAGGRSLSLLEKSDIEEGKGYGGFPVSGQWLICKNKEVIQQHHAKVYGKAAIGSPPMSVPHLDTRIIKGKQELLFGPFAGFSTKFLKKGSYMDLLFSIQANNIMPMLAAGFHNIPLTRYLIGQVIQSMDERMDALKDFYPMAKDQDWELRAAGMRVQVIKKDPKETGVLEFGTEIVRAADGTIAALLGASPGASTAVSIMLKLVKNCFEAEMTDGNWNAKLKQMISSYGVSLGENDMLGRVVRERSADVLQLQE
jgi:malate dehydrogenase (quinone)